MFGKWLKSSGNSVMKHFELKDKIWYIRLDPNNKTQLYKLGNDAFEKLQGPNRRLYFRIRVLSYAHHGISFPKSQQKRVPDKPLVESKTKNYKRVKFTKPNQLGIAAATSTAAAAASAGNGGDGGGSVLPAAAAGSN